MSARTRSLWPLIVCVALAALAAAGLPPAVAQDGGPTGVVMTVYASNPVLTVGDGEAWDHAFVSAGNVLLRDGTFHMFYAGGASYMGPHSIGYATSPDGLSWTKYDGNPILIPDPDLTPMGIEWAFPAVEGDTWVLYFHSKGGNQTSAMRATAPAPTGPWTIDPTPIFQGASDGWDKAFRLIAADSAADERVIYYRAMLPDAQFEYGVGKAVSTDGATWTLSAQPVFTSGPDGQWKADMDGISLPSPAIAKTEHGWEMVYSRSSDGTGTIGRWVGYAFSPDGVAWTRFGDASLLTLRGSDLYSLSSIVPVDDKLYVYYNMLMYTDKPESVIGVITVERSW